MEELISYTEQLILLEAEKEQIESSKQNPRFFKPLYNKYYERIFRFLYKRTGNKEDAADITSQVFYKALINIKKYNHRGLLFSSWLFRIAVNESNLLFRKQKKQQHIILDESHINALSEEVQLIEEDDSLKQLKTAIRSLKSSELNIIELRFFEGFSFKEVGEILKITENNAKVKCYRVLDKLRIKMETK